MAAARRRSPTSLIVAVIVAIVSAIVTALSRGHVVPQSAPAAPPRAAPATASRWPSGTPAPPTARPSSVGFTNRQHLVEHFEKHGEEFPGLSMAQYLAAAQTLRDAPTGGDILEVRRSDGVVTRFDKRSGAFLAVNRDRTIRTFFRPNDGERYFRRQASRLPGGGP